jgi:hypothetical protein
MSLNQYSLNCSYAYSFQQKEATRWYLALYGRERFDRLYHNCERAFAEQIHGIRKGMHNENNDDNKNLTKTDIAVGVKRKEIRRFIQNRAVQIEQYDKSIVAYYHGYIKCDKIVDFPEGSEYRDRYYKYVGNDMPKRFINIVMNLVYPEFLRIYHQTNQKLIEFTETLPDYG